jgi:hypothetical protein
VLSDVPSIKSRIKQAQSVLIPWFKTKDAYADAYQMKRLQEAEDLQNQIIDMASKIHLMFHSPLRTNKEKYGPGKDWRNATLVVKGVARLYNQINAAKKAAADRKIADFISVVDRMQSTIQTLINTVLKLDREGYMENTGGKKEGVSQLKLKAKTNSEKVSNWRSWVEENTGEKLDEKSPKEIFDELNRRLRLIADRERDTWDKKGG